MTGRLVLLMAKEAGWSKIELHSDLKDKIQASNVQDTRIATIPEAIEELGLSFEHCSFTSVPRRGNVSSRTLTSHAIRLVNDIQWERNFPVWLTKSVQKDTRAVAPFYN